MRHGMPWRAWARAAQSLLIGFEEIVEDSRRTVVHPIIGYRISATLRIPSPHRQQVGRQFDRRLRIYS